MGHLSCSLAPYSPTPQPVWLLLRKEPNGVYGDLPSYSCGCFNGCNESISARVTVVTDSNLDTFPSSEWKDIYISPRPMYRADSMFPQGTLLPSVARLNVGFPPRPFLINLSTIPYIEQHRWKLEYVTPTPTSWFGSPPVTLAFHHKDFEREWMIIILGRCESGESGAGPAMVSKDEHALSQTRRPAVGEQQRLGSRYVSVWFHHPTSGPATNPESLFVPHRCPHDHLDRWPNCSHEFGSQEIGGSVFRIKISFKKRPPLDSDSEQTLELSVDDVVSSATYTSLPKTTEVCESYQVNPDPSSVSYPVFTDLERGFAEPRYSARARALEPRILRTPKHPLWEFL